MSDESSIDRVLRLAKEAGYSISEFAIAISETPQVVSNWKSRRKVPASKLYKIAELLSNKLGRSISMMYLYNGKIDGLDEKVASDPREFKSNPVYLPYLDVDLIEDILDAIEERRRELGAPASTHRQLALTIADTYADLMREIRFEQRSRLKAIIKKSFNNTNCYSESKDSESKDIVS
jgi:transcriptional regulator with XRE-family HTH domain